MSTRKYVSLSKLSTFLDKLKTTFASLTHTHTISDLTDYAVDSALSDTSVNPVQNKVVNEEFESIATGMNALESAIDAASTSNTPVTTTAYINDTYTATVSGITALSTGVSFIMIPLTASTTTTPKLNVNGLGEKYIRRRLSGVTGNTVVGSYASWLSANKPIRVTYDGAYWIVDSDRPSATDIYGVVPIASGGTGASSAALARENLGAMAEVPATEADAGKVLTVDLGGEPTWAEPSSSGGRMIVNITKSDGTYSADKSYDEVLSYWNAGYSVWSYIDDEELRFPLTSHASLGGYFVFAGVYVNNSTGKTYVRRYLLTVANSIVSSDVALE